MFKKFFQQFAQIIPVRFLFPSQFFFSHGLFQQGIRKKESCPKDCYITETLQNNLL